MIDDCVDDSYQAEMKAGYFILTIEGHRIKTPEKCVETFKYFIVKKKRLSIDVLVSMGAMPQGVSRLLVKVDRKKGSSDDGSLQGLFLEEEGGVVKVKSNSESGMFATAKINKR